jgi:photosystem II stability/assembly factor-like uncharacterized protein
MPATRLVAATGESFACLSSADGNSWSVSTSLEGRAVQCVAVDPHNPERVYAGTLDDGVHRSTDAGQTWESVGAGIPHARVMSVAISHSDREGKMSAVYVGTEPSELFRSGDDGSTWSSFPTLPELPSQPTWSFPPRPWTSHVRWIALHHDDPNLLFAGIELGGVMRSADRGLTWEDRKPGSYHDCHALRTHPLAPGRVYEAAGGGVAMSDDFGATWTTVDAGMDRHYVWGLAVDPADPDLWYVSATYGAREAHRSNGQSEAKIFRKRGHDDWQALSDTSLPYMPYSLLTLQGRPGSLVAGMQDGSIFVSDNEGDDWRRIDVRLPGILALAEAPL